MKSGLRTKRYATAGFFRRCERFYEQVDRDLGLSEHRDLNSTEADVAVIGGRIGMVERSESERQCQAGADNHDRRFSQTNRRAG